MHAVDENPRVSECSVVGGIIDGFLIMDLRAVAQRLLTFSGGIAQRALAKVFSIVSRSKSAINLQRRSKPCVIAPECVRVGHEM